MQRRWINIERNTHTHTKYNVFIRTTARLRINRKDHQKNALMNRILTTNVHKEENKQIPCAVFGCKKYQHARAYRNTFAAQSSLWLSQIELNNNNNSEQPTEPQINMVVVCARVQNIYNIRQKSR